MFLSRLFFMGFFGALLFPAILRAQVMIHAHNDYDQRHPLSGAIREKASSIEADVFPVHGKLMVAHDKDDITSSRTLDAMYLEPIVKDFSRHGGKTVSSDPGYTFYLMIDIKEAPDTVLPLLISLLKRHPACFDREANPMAVQVFISGNRPPDTTFHLYPAVIMFDGLPGKSYRPADAAKVVMISADFQYYSHWDGETKFPGQDAERLRGVITNAHRLGKPVRFWGAPDTRDCWRVLINLGANVINTDHVKACRKFLAPDRKERRRSVSGFSQGGTPFPR
jgi:alkaline phosphatase